MTTRIDTSALVALAKAATPGPWASATDDDCPDDVRVCYVRDGEHCEWCIALSGETLDGKQWTPETLARWRADAAFISAANPATIIALCEEVERAKADAETAWANDAATSELLREQKDALDGALDDIFGLQPVNATFDDALSAIRQNVDERGREYEAMRVDRDRLRALALEAVAIAEQLDNYVPTFMVDGGPTMAQRRLAAIKAEVGK